MLLRFIEYIGVGTVIPEGRVEGVGCIVGDELVFAPPPPPPDLSGSVGCEAAVAYMRHVFKCEANQLANPELNV